MAIETDRLISAAPTSPQEEAFERALRPKSLAEYIGQEKIRGQLGSVAEAARNRKAGLALPGALAAILTSLVPNDVLFIDEIHRLACVVEEILCPALEDYQTDIMI